MSRSLKLALIALAIATPLQGQSVRDAFLSLYTFGQCGLPLCLDLEEGNRHGDHYNPAFVAAGADLLGFVQNAIGLAVSSVPFTAAASGVTYSFEGGAPIATAVSAGPIFADRAETLGRGRFLIGANVSGMSFSELRGQPIDRLMLRFTHENVGSDAETAPLGSPSFERDYIEIVTNLDLNLYVTTVYATLGVTDRIDIGVAVPLVRSSLSGTSRAEFVWWEPDSPHYFGSASNPQQTANASAEQTAFGVGDIAARVKVFVANGLGLIGDVRLATGDEDDFLGSGATTARLMAVGSARMGSFSPHLNGGVLLSNADWQNDRLLSTVGFDQLVGEQVTLAFDLVGSFQLGVNQLGLPDPVAFLDPQPILPLTDVPDEADHFIDASIGAKIAAGNDFRIVANVLVPINSGGLRPGVLWTAGLEKTF